jgi:glyoxylase-like metal-dependent hydrolase (beta-lactamase superfamily II)
VEIAPDIRRIGPGLANVYLIQEAGAVTIVDAGMPGYWHALPAELAAMGRSLEDVRAVVLTHAHSDHIGFAERIRTERGVPIRVHELDELRAKGRVPGPRGLGSFKLLPLLEFLIFGLRNGLRSPPILEVATFDDGATLDVPGAPRVIHVPGHTEGSAALHFVQRDVICVGDALVTRNVINGAEGPQLFPNFSTDNELAFASLARFDGVDARLVLAGHGASWDRGLAEAVRLTRESWRTGTTTPAG